MEEYLIPVILVMTWVEYVWELYLSIRQHSVYRNVKTVPKELSDSITQETFEKSRLYALDKSTFSIVKGTYSTILTTAMLQYYFIYHMWEFSKVVLQKIGLEQGEMSVSAVFMVVTMTVNVFTSMPFTVYSTFVLEEKHGFNKQTAGFFIKDQIKAYVVSTVLTVPITVASIYIIKAGGEYFYVYLWVFCMVLVFFFMTIYHDYIAPLFDKYTPLPEGELRKRIEELATSLKFPLYKLYLVEGSKRSFHSNAYFYGFFKNKRIVLFDTLLKDESKNDGKGCDNDEIVAVLSHEFGHWQYNHVLKNLIILQVNLFLLFFACGFLLNHEVLYRAFMFDHEKPVMIGLIIIFQFIFSPYHALTSFLMTILSRKFEFQADYFALSLGKAAALRSALIKLHTDNLSFPVFDWLYSSWHHSHPPILERLEALKKGE